MSSEFSTFDSESNVFYLYYSENARCCKKPLPLLTYTGEHGLLAVGQFICKDKDGEAFDWPDKQLIAVVNDVQRSVERMVSEHESKALADDRLLRLYNDTVKMLNNHLYGKLRITIRNFLEKGHPSQLARIAAQIALDTDSNTATRFCEFIEDVEAERK